jgi:hypothetical protein
MAEEPKIRHRLSVKEGSVLIDPYTSELVEIECRGNVDGDTNWNKFILKTGEFEFSHISYFDEINAIEVNVSNRDIKIHNSIALNINSMGFGIIISTLNQPKSISSGVVYEIESLLFEFKFEAA